jgi:hypothetical protein
MRQKLALFDHLIVRFVPKGTSVRRAQGKLCCNGIAMLDTTTALKGEAGIKFFAHLRCLGSKRHATEQLTCSAATLL